jgi:hypothetical protein
MFSMSPGNSYFFVTSVTMTRSAALLCDPPLTNLIDASLQAIVCCFEQPQFPVAARIVLSTKAALGKGVPGRFDFDDLRELLFFE